MIQIQNEDYEIHAAFYSEIRKFLKVSQQNANGAGITIECYELLLWMKGLENHDRANMDELSKFLSLDQRKTLSLCRKAEQHGLIIKCTNPKNHSQFCFHLTNKGANLIDLVIEKDQDELAHMHTKLLRFFFKFAG